MTRKVALSELQPQLVEILDRVQEDQDRFVITREGRDEAVLLSADEFEGLLETLEILSDSELVRELMEARAELAAGGGHSLQDVRRGLQGGHRQALKSG
jgi:antitoxin YefM